MKTRNQVLSILAILCVYGLAQGYFESPNQSFKGKSEMNGIKFEKYRDFTSRWKLVTVRYRHDSGELRLTYANESAFRHLEKGALGPYPDGAAFGKVSFKTERDPAFASSEVPTGARRYQLMVKDSKRYREQDAWGYALFDADGLTFDEDPKQKVLSCHACHQVVKEKNFVFSELAPFAVGQTWKPKNPFVSMISWEKTEASQLPASLQSILSSERIGAVSLMKGPMNAHFFSGTLDEVVPSLIEKSLAENAAAAFVGDTKNFSVVIPKKDRCSLIKVLFNDRLVRDEKKCAPR